MTQRWNPNNLQDIAQRLVSDPSGAGRDLDQTIQVMNRQLNAQPQFADNETPKGSINGTNATFTLANTPSPAASLQLIKNGLVLRQGVGYRLSGNTITYLAGYIPAPGDVHVAYYRY